MKKIILLLLLVAPFISFGQTVEAKLPVKEQYCMLIAQPKLFSTKATIKVDFGKDAKSFGMTDQQLNVWEAKLKEYNSIVDALNYMATHGWSVVNSYFLTSDGMYELNYILKRTTTS